MSCDVTSNMVSYEAQQKADQVSGQQTSLHILLSISFTAMQWLKPVKSKILEMSFISSLF